MLYDVGDLTFAFSGSGNMHVGYNLSAVKPQAHLL
jgi:hypothetical protein